MSFAKDDTIELYINSTIDKREGDTEASFTVDFSDPVRIGNQKSLKMAVKTLACPNTCPQFANDEIAYSVEQEGYPKANLFIDQTRVFPSVADFLTYLQASLNALTGVNLSIVQNANTKKVEITNNSSGYIRLFLSEHPKFWRKLGYEVIQENEPNYLEISSSGLAVSLKVTRLIRTQRYYLACPDVYNNAKTKDSNFSTIISAIDLETAWGSYNSEQMPFLYFHDLTNSNNLDSLTFRLLDDERRQVERLEGGGVQIGLILKRDDI